MAAQNYDPLTGGSASDFNYNTFSTGHHLLLVHLLILLLQGVITTTLELLALLIQV
jgi:hypothetical protein